VAIPEIEKVNATKRLFAFTSFRARLLTFLSALLIPILGVTLFYVNRNNNDYTEETINRFLTLASEVFDFTREQEAETLEVITQSLTWDFGFRSAYASNDPATLFDASLNVLDRSMDNTHMLMVVGLDHEVIIDTALQGYSVLEGALEELLLRAESSPELSAETITSVNDVPYQLIAFPLYLPRQVAWVIGGFALDENFVLRVSETLSDSQVSIVEVDRLSAIEVIASTLEVQQREDLAAQLNVNTQGIAELQRIRYADEEWTTLLTPLFQSDMTGNTVLAVFQRSYDENQVNVIQFRRLLIQFYLLIFALGLIAVILLARSISQPLTRLAAVVRRIEEGDYAKRAEVTSGDELGDLAESVNNMASGLAEKEKVRDLLGKVVSQQIAEELLNNPVELGGEERVVTILFSDIRGFTSYCEGLPPGEVLTALNEVLSTVSNIIESHNGVVDKFQGDAVMALFGAPVTGERDAQNAMAAALEIVQTLEGMDSRLSACVGINTGLVVAGNLGSDNRLNYSVIGDTVNLASRLESLTRLYGTASIVSAASAEAAPGFAYRELDEVIVAGKQKPVKIFELLGEEGALSSDVTLQYDRFATALQAYRDQDWVLARELFIQLQRSCDNSDLCQVFLDRIQFFSVNPPPAEWQGVYAFDKK